MEEKRNEVMVKGKKRRNFVAWPSWCEDTIWPPVCCKGLVHPETKSDQLILSSR